LLAERFASELAIANGWIVVDRKVAERAGAKGRPLGMYVDAAGVVRQIGFLTDRSGLATFVSGCPNASFRRWARSADLERLSTTAAGQVG
jgi:hypothetical protein